MADSTSKGYRLVQVRSKHHVKEFLQVPWYIYRNDDNWIPHLKQDIEKVFDPGKNKAFRHGDAVRWILLDSTDRCVGRVAAFVDDRVTDKYKQPTGGMGFFECIDDRDAAFTLFDACKHWLQKRGMEAMDGPINFGERIAFWGMLIDNFEAPPTYQLAYNPPYYRDLFEAYGFEVYFYQYVYTRELVGPAPDVFLEKSKELREDPRFQIRNVRKMKDEEIAKNFMEVFNDAWAHRDGYKPLRFEQAMKIIKALTPVKDPDITMFCFYDGRPIAFYINIPELNEIFKHVNGDLNLVGKLKFLWHRWRHTSNVMLGLVFGVVNDFQGRGVEGAMVDWCAREVATLDRYDYTVLTWVGDFNPKMLRVCENLDAKLHKTLVTYRHLFDPDAPFERAPIEGDDDDPPTGG